MPRYGRTSRGKLSCHVGRKSRLESPAALRQRRITRRLEAATSIPSPMRSQCLNWALGATVFCITAKRPPFGRYGSIAPNAARVLQQRMSVAPRKRQLATKVRRVVKGQEETHALQQNQGDLAGQLLKSLANNRVPWRPQT